MEPSAGSIAALNAAGASTAAAAAGAAGVWISHRSPLSWSSVKTVTFGMAMSSDGPSGVLASARTTVARRALRATR
eukprot:20724-Pelagococcus_subviridis.AAC.1